MQRSSSCRNNGRTGVSNTLKGRRRVASHFWLNDESLGEEMLCLCAVGCVYACRRSMNVSVLEFYSINWEEKCTRRTSDQFEYPNLIFSDDDDSEQYKKKITEKPNSAYRVSRVNLLLFGIAFVKASLAKWSGARKTRINIFLWPRKFLLAVRLCGASVSNVREMKNVCSRVSMWV